MKRIAILAIRLYRILISPILPPNTCRFYPTCSAYSLEAFEKYNFFKALWLSIKRIARCHPLNEGGYDPLP